MKRSIIFEDTDADLIAQLITHRFQYFGASDKQNRILEIRNRIQRAFLAQPDAPRAAQPDEVPF